jgi:enoyl-CoA hydratase/carnithine racemase
MRYMEPDLKYSNIEFTVDGKIGIITLNRPEKRNALSYDLLLELEDLLTKLRRDRSIKVVIIKGNGKIFSSGHDLTELMSPPTTVEKLFKKCYDVMTLIRNIPQTVIAMVHGMATAAGCQLVAVCDLAIAEESTKFSLPGIKIGLYCSTPVVFVSRVIGRKRAYEMAITGEFIDAKTALEWGLVNRVVPIDELERTTFELANKIAKYSFTALESGKRLFYKQIVLEDFHALELGTEVISLQTSSDSAREGIRAFLEKREPVWKE